MKKYLLSALGCGLLVAPAYAADLAVEVAEPPPAYVAKEFSWTGIYFGGFGGYGGDKFEYPFEYCPKVYDGRCKDHNWQEIDPITGQFDLTSSGFFAGGQVGFNWQVNKFVLGAVADIAWSDVKGEVGAEIDDLGRIEAGSQVNWFGTIRGKIGFTPVERLHIYGTGGFAYGDVEHYLNIGDEGTSTSSTQTGWTAGAGFEYAVTNRVTLFTEYLYVDLGDENLLDGCAFDCSGGFHDHLSLDAETQFHTIKAGLNILLN